MPRTLMQAERDILSYLRYNNVEPSEFSTDLLNRFIQDVKDVPSYIPVEHIAINTGITHAIEALGRESNATTSQQIRVAMPRAVRGTPRNYHMNLSSLHSTPYADESTNNQEEAEVDSDFLRQGTFYSGGISSDNLLRGVVSPIAEMMDTASVYQSQGYTSFTEPLDSFSIEDLMPPQPPRRNQRSEHDMIMEIVVGENFPKPNFKDWETPQMLGAIVDSWYRQAEYKDNWIFNRREREGFNRRNIGQFSLDDVMAKMSKRKKGHVLDNEHSKFYDWKLGGTDWTLRLELYQHEHTYFLISRYIHNPTDVEVKYDIRYWKNDRFKHLTGITSEYKDNDTLFERVLGNSDSYDSSEDYYDGDDD